MEGKGHRFCLPSGSEFFKQTICKKEKQNKKEMEKKEEKIERKTGYW